MHSSHLVGRCKADRRLGRWRVAVDGRRTWTCGRGAVCARVACVAPARRAVCRVYPSIPSMYQLELRVPSLVRVLCLQTAHMLSSRFAPTAVRPCRARFPVLGRGLSLSPLCPSTCLSRGTVSSFYGVAGATAAHAATANAARAADDTHGRTPCTRNANGSRLARPAPGIWVTRPRSHPRGVTGARSHVISRSHARGRPAADAAARHKRRCGGDCWC